MVFIYFLQVTLKPREAPSSAENLLPVLRDWQKNDRSVFDKANRAFVSFVQAYSKHECKYILRLKGKFKFVLVCKVLFFS